MPPVAVHGTTAYPTQHALRQLLDIMHLHQATNLHIRSISKAMRPSGEVDTVPCLESDCELAVEHPFHDLAANVLHPALLPCVLMPGVKRHRQPTIHHVLDHLETHVLRPLLLRAMLCPRCRRPWHDRIYITTRVASAPRHHALASSHQSTHKEHQQGDVA